MTPTLHSYHGLSAKGFHKVVYREWLPEGRTYDNGRTVICVHGLTRNGRDFDALAADLANHGYRVICPDVVGRGDSDRLADSKGYAYPQYLGDMAALIARLDVEAGRLGRHLHGRADRHDAGRPAKKRRSALLS